MPISTDRIRDSIEAIARFTETPGNGTSRPTFSEPWQAARDYVIDQAKAAGCTIRIDAAGNVHARQTALVWDSPAWLCGSHIDSVPHGGDYDGVAGVVVPLEILRAAAEENRAIPLELIIFAEEEGTTFGLGMLGSRAWVGELTEEQLANVFNKAGENYLNAGTAHGVAKETLRAGHDRLIPSHYHGLIEIHIEQGLGMWNRNDHIAVVRAIAGRKQYRCMISGVANHAGSTSMRDRRDALAAAAEMILQLESLAKELSPETVITVGRIDCKPNAINVIPDAVEFTIDFRAPDNNILTGGHDRIANQIRSIADARGLKFELTPTENQPAVAMSPQVCDALSQAALKELNHPAPITISGALHDSAILAPHIPTAMLFIPSRGGISHNSAEFSRIEDIAAAARIVYQAITS